MLPPSDKLSICVAHVAYRLHERFSALDTGISSFAVRDLASLEKRVGEAHVPVISGLWQNSLLDRAKKLCFIQSIGAGTDQFPRDEPAKRGIRLASARGVNAQAVADHAIALILASSRRLPEARDNQAKRVWRGMIGDLAEREDELGGKTLLASVLAISADASPGSPRLSTCASSGCGAIRGPAEALRMRCTRWKSSSRSCPRPISLLSAVRLRISHAGALENPRSSRQMISQLPGASGADEPDGPTQLRQCGDARRLIPIAIHKREKPRHHRPLPPLQDRRRILA